VFSIPYHQGSCTYPIIQKCYNKETDGTLTLKSYWTDDSTASANLQALGDPIQYLTTIATSSGIYVVPDLLAPSCAADPICWGIQKITDFFKWLFIPNTQLDIARFQTNKANLLNKAPFKYFDTVLNASYSGYTATSSPTFTLDIIGYGGTVSASQTVSIPTAMANLVDGMKVVEVWGVYALLIIYLFDVVKRATHDFQ
jgi:hypothetical protein